MGRAWEDGVLNREALPHSISLSGVLKKRGTISGALACLLIKELSETGGGDELKSSLLRFSFPSPSPR